MSKLMLGVILMALGFAARAEIVAICGAAEGHYYYPLKPPIPEKNAGWGADKITNGNFQLIRSGSDWDIVFTDATGRTQSSRADGGRTVGLVNDDGDVVVTVFYAGSFETWIFWLSMDKPVVSWSQAKFGSFIPKHSLMVSPCKRP
jgi:hypothetical protein